MKPVRILLADDHTVVLEGLRRILDRPEFEIVGAVQDGRALIDAAEKLNPDIIVADVSMPSLNGIEAVRQVRKRCPRSKILFLSMHRDTAYAVEALSSGGSGYVLKDSAGEDLVTAIREVQRGRTWVTPSIEEPVMRALESRRDSSAAAGQLTERQREVLQLVAEGKTPKEIAAVLNVSSRTVEFHKYRIMKTLGLRTIAELATYAVKQGMV